MAYKVTWSPKAVKTFNNVINYLEKNWTEKEIRNFVRLTDKVAHIISKSPYLFRSSEKNNVFEVLVTKHNLLLYQVNEESKKVQLLAFFDTRQDPKKKKSKKK